MNSLAPKLVVLAALLSAVAFAAPRGMMHEVEAAELVQTEAQATASKVESLKAEFAKIQSELQSGAKVTPGVVATITKLIKMVEDEIEPAIEDAHRADQEIMEAHHQQLLDLNSAYRLERDALLDDAANIRKDQNAYNVDVGEWEQATKDYTLSKSVFLSTFNKMQDVCCQKDHAGVLDVVYTPAYYACDFTNDDTADGCVDRADASIAGLTVKHFGAGKSKYDDLFTRCNGLTEDFRLAGIDLNAKNTECDEKRDDAKNMQEKIRLARATFDPIWADSVTYYNGNWTKDLGTFDATVSRVKHDEGDRHAEWQAVEEIKCMLRAYRREGTFNTDTLASCNKAVSTNHITNVYPTAPAKEHSDLPAWIKMLTYDAFSHVCEPDNEPKPKHIPCVTSPPKPYPSCSNHVV